MSNALGLGSELPWLAATQTRVRQAHTAARLGHALLVQGSPGVGATWLAGWIAALALCERQPQAPCGSCRACAQVLMRQHPDYYWLEPIEDSHEIRIDQVRALLQDLSLTTHGRGAKVAVLAPADRLNRNAANALLKTLEEPSANSLLILVAAQPGRLPATLRSRCLRLELPSPDLGTAQAWLTAQGASAAQLRLLETLGLQPLDVLAIDAASAEASVAETRAGIEQALAGKLDIVSAADSWSRSDYAWRLVCIESWLTDQLQQAVAGPGASANLRAGAHLPVPPRALNIRALFELLDEVREMRHLIDAPLNRSLVLERLLWRLSATTQHSAASG